MLLEEVGPGMIIQKVTMIIQQARVKLLIP